MEVYLIIGQCGVGKTWLMKKLIEQYETTSKGKLGKVNFNLNETKNIYILGNYDGTMYEGSDKLSMAVASDFQLLYHYMLTIENPIVICEGDRFTNKTFLQTFKPTIIKIKGDGETGRLIRNSSQSERQLKSIATRISNIKEHIAFEDSNETLTYFTNKNK